ncbi:unnamed protein product [Protopolystoma xenopodis]|uniref:Uncharacterized protein n=1 Tax=Protopolystoma xenopodis TaxID=117903 RepID=A0A3S5A2H9_9PLAT|nr:unnamed protein product [Protopolystoma xenopodis]
MTAISSKSCALLDAAPSLDPESHLFLKWSFLVSNGTLRGWPRRLFDRRNSPYRAQHKQAPHVYMLFLLFCCSPPLFWLLSQTQLPSPRTFLHVVEQVEMSPSSLPPHHKVITA